MTPTLVAPLGGSAYVHCMASKVVGLSSYMISSDGWTTAL